MGEQSGDDEVVDVAVCPKCSIMTEHTILKKAAKGKIDYLSTPRG